MLPREEVDVIVVTPAMVENCRSRIDATEAAIVSGLAPGSEALTEMVELPREVHPWFVGVQFHPEFKSTPWDGHPLFNAFIKAALDHQAQGKSLKVVA